MNEISHGKARALIQKAADSLLAEKEATLLSAHLVDCDACQAYQKEVKGIQTAIRSSLRRRVTYHANRAAQPMRTKQSVNLTQRLRRNIRMKNAQKFSFALVGTLILATLIFGIVSLIQQTIPTPTVASNPTKLPKDEGKVTITFAAYSEAGAEAYYQSLITEFHTTYPEIDVQFVPIDMASSPSSENIATLADVVSLTGINPATLPGFITLQPLLDATPDFSLGDYWPGSLTACSNENGSLYGIPLSVSPVGIYYNPEILDRYQIPHPKAGWTWADFNQIVERLRNHKETAPFYVLAENPAYSVLDPKLDQRIHSNNGKIDPDAISEDIQWYLQLAEGKLLFPQPSATEFSGTDYYQQFSSVIRDSKVGMWIGSPNRAIPGYIDGKGVFVPFPINTPDNSANPAYYSCGAISAGSRNPRQAWTWLNFLSQHTSLIYENNGVLPARRSLVDTDSFWNGTNKNESDAMLFAVEHAWYPSIPLQKLNLVKNAINKAIRSGTDPIVELQAAEVASNSTQANESTPTSEPFVVKPPEPTPAAEVQQVTFMANWGGNESYHQALEALSSDFMTLHPDIKI